MEGSIEDIYKGNYDKNSVVIIGSGPCGILATKYLKQNNNVICIDNREDIGGQWHFDTYNEQDHPNLKQNSFYHHYGVLPSSLYENLQANLPRYLMTFKGFPSKPEYQEFMKADEFQEYLQDYCSLHHLKKFMLFNTFVSSVRLVKNLNPQEKEKVGFELTKKFVIEIKEAGDYTQNVRYLQADHVVVATGHYSVPNYPKIGNIDLFKGQKIHSHYFRQKTLEQFKGKHLVIYGASQSAQDLVCIILKQTDQEMQPSKITLIGNSKTVDRLKLSEAYKEEIESKKVVFAPTYIKQFVDEKSVVLESGEIVQDIDEMMYATGYKYVFPFLENYNDSLIDFVNENDRKNSCGPLYKRMFCVREPNLIFLGMTFNTISIQQMFERQVICAQRVIDGEIQLPSQEEMQREYEEDFKKSLYDNKDGRDYLKVSYFAGLNELDYSRSLSEFAQMKLDEEFNNYVKDLYVPISFNLLHKGNFPWMKQQKVSHKLPLMYSPPEGLF